MKVKSKEKKSGADDKKGNWRMEQAEWAAQDQREIKKEGGKENRKKNEGTHKEWEEKREK